MLKCRVVPVTSRVCDVTALPLTPLPRPIFCSLWALELVENRTSRSSCGAGVGSLGFSGDLVEVEEH